MRKIIQIASSVLSREDNGTSFFVVRITALCDDGTVWCRDNDDGEWWPINAISQEAP